MGTRLLRSEEKVAKLPVTILTEMRECSTRFDPSGSVWGVGLALPRLGTTRQKKAGLTFGKWN